MKRKEIITEYNKTIEGVKEALITILLMIGIFILLALISGNIFFFARGGFLSCCCLMILTIYLAWENNVGGTK